MNNAVFLEIKNNLIDEKPNASCLSQLLLAHLQYHADV
jgi:hypothetical protein